MITEAAVRRLNAAYAGRAFDEAYLELAQEHFLDFLRDKGLIDDLVFKGGTSLRKFVFGLQGRFSLDLDFQASGRAVGEVVIDELEKGFTHQGVAFSGFDIDHRAMKGAWFATTPELGESRLACRLDFSTRPLLLPAVKHSRQTLPGIDEKSLGFVPVDMRIADLRETCAEKLARLRRVLFARDVYDLSKLIPMVRDDLSLVRELLLFKVFFDVVDDGRGIAPFELPAEFASLDAKDILGAEEIGALTQQKVDLASMLKTTQSGCSQMNPAATDKEKALARCNRGDRFQAQRWQTQFQKGHEERGAV